MTLQALRYCQSQRDADDYESTDYVVMNACRQQEELIPLLSRSVSACHYGIMDGQEYAMTFVLYCSFPFVSPSQEHHAETLCVVVLKSCPLVVVAFPMTRMG